MYKIIAHTALILHNNGNSYSICDLVCLFKVIQGDLGTI